MENNLYVSPSPHIHGGDSISKNMYGVLIALIPAFLVSLYFFGLGALIVTVVSVLARLRESPRWTRKNALPAALA